MGRCRTDHLAVPLPGRKPSDGVLAGQRRVVLRRSGRCRPSLARRVPAARRVCGPRERRSRPTPEAVTDEVKESGLRGRGGAYFPAAIKWESARKFTRAEVPRGQLRGGRAGHLQGPPHHGGDAAPPPSRGRSSRHTRPARGQPTPTLTPRPTCRRGGSRQPSTRHTSADCWAVTSWALGPVSTSRYGAGPEGYVCGDETTLLNTMEGYRREPRIKPPLPIESGLWGKPTVINNAETLASVPFIVSEGASAFMDIGENGDAGTKLISLSGSVRQPGLVEVPMGHDAAGDHIRAWRRAKRRPGHLGHRRRRAVERSAPRLDARHPHRSRAAA